jgi:hypothetical protein
VGERLDRELHVWTAPALQVGDEDLATPGSGAFMYAAKVGDFLFRYMRARHWFKDQLDRPLPAHELATLIELGKQEFDEIYIEPDANPPIVLDGKADDVFDAIIKKRYRAIPFCDPEFVAA